MISDSQTAFRSIESFQVNCKIHKVINNRIHKIVNDVKLSGNEYADSLAKDAAKLHQVDYRFSLSYNQKQTIVKNHIR